MPSVSDRQHRAMQAAAHGQSTLGIPKSVGREFVKADQQQPKRPSKTHRGRRSRGNHALKMGFSESEPASVASPDGQYHVHKDGSDHMGEANKALEKARAHPTKAGTLKHLFVALSKLKKAK